MTYPCPGSRLASTLPSSLAYQPPSRVASCGSHDGWFGRVLDSRRARIRVPGLDAAVAVAVAVQDFGNDKDAELRAGVDAAYRAKYWRYGSTTVDRMVNDDAAATTLQLNREQATPAGEDE